MSAAKDQLTDDFRQETITVRGVEYTFRELSAEEYDDIIKMASGEDDNAELAVVLKLMAARCLVKPELTPDQLSKKPYPVYQQLLRVINKMHFQPEEEGSPNS